MRRRRFKPHMRMNAIQLDSARAMGKAIEFPGNLRSFAAFGGCGTHPQFRHLETPPAGYRFIHSADGRPRRGVWQTWKLIFQFVARCRRRGAHFGDIWKFFWSRNLRSQFKMGVKEGLFSFFPSVPFHFGQFPWMIEIEDTTSMFLPFIKNGATADLKPLNTQSFFAIFQELFESPLCHGIITHVRSTSESIPRLFNNPGLKNKVFYIPIGINLPDWEEVQKIKKRRGDGPLILFTNSWHQMPGGFIVRGGLSVLESFAEIKKSVPTAHLLIRSKLPKNLSSHYRDLIRDLGVEIVEDFVPNEQWEQLKMEADYFIFPAARIHIVSLLEAMGYGMSIIASNGWGIDEYLENDRNAVIIPGYEKISRMDYETGLLRENYTAMYSSNPDMVKKIVAAFNRLHGNPELKRKITDQARQDVETKYTLVNWNEKLGSVFDHVTKTIESEINLSSVVSSPRQDHRRPGDHFPESKLAYSTARSVADRVSPE